MRTQSSAANFSTTICRRLLKACLMRRMLEMELAVDAVSMALLEVWGAWDWWLGILVWFGRGIGG